MEKERPYYLQSGEDVLRDLGVATESGLSEAAVRERLARHGPNQLRGRKPRGGWSVLSGPSESGAGVWLLGATAVGPGRVDAGIAREHGSTLSKPRRVASSTRPSRTEDAWT